MTSRTIVIVGASLAGASAAAALRKQGFEGRIVLVGDEDAPPYERPEVSKKYLRGEIETPVLVQPDGFYASHDIELRTGERADALDLRSREVQTSRGTLPFDGLLLATGASPRMLDVPGATLDGVVTLRDAADADAIRRRAASATNVVVVGGGWIGSETAASLRQMGHDITLVMSTRTPLERVLGREIGEVYGRAHEQHGVRLVAGATVSGFVGSDHVQKVRLDDGRELPADLVVAGVGATPRIELGRDAGLAIDDGIAVDQYLESSVPGIFAAGDVAAAWNPRYGRRLRPEHWDNARRQGRTAAANLLGKQEAYDRVPYFYSDQYDLDMEYRGHAAHWEEIVVRGDLEAHSFVAFWMAGGRILAAMNLNASDDRSALEALVRAQATVEPDVLRDPAVVLGELSSVA